MHHHSVSTFQMNSHEPRICCRSLLHNRVGNAQVAPAFKIPDAVQLSAPNVEREALIDIGNAHLFARSDRPSEMHVGAPIRKITRDFSIGLTCMVKQSAKDGQVEPIARFECIAANCGASVTQLIEPHDSHFVFAKISQILACTDRRIDTKRLVIRVRARTRTKGARRYCRGEQ